jgi:hypothetical protein
METCADLDADAPPEMPPHAPPHPVRRRHPKPPKHGWLRELGIVLGFYYVYQTIRSLADVGGVKNRAHSNAHWLVSAEKSMFIFHEQSIQQAFLGATWFIKAMNVYYGTLHFIITAGLLIWLYAKRHGAYRRLRNLLGATTGLALIGYWAFPLAPPRLYLQCDGNIPALGPEGGLVKPVCFVDTLDKIGGLWNYQSSAAKAIANAYAAMPSLHFGWALWCAIVIWQEVGGRKGRVLAVLYPALTLFAIVVTANHYFLDAVGGAMILGGGLAIVRWGDRRRSAKAAAAPAAELAPAE